MSGGYLSDAAIFLIQTFVGLAVILFLIRVLLQLVRANFFNPVCQFIAKATNPILIPLKRVIPNLGRLDVAGVLVAWILQALELKLVVSLRGGGISVINLLALSFVQMLDLVLVIFMFVIFVKVILSWVAPHGDNPLQPVLYQVSQPVLGPLQRMLPNLGGLDLSPLLALVAIQLTRLVLVRPLQDLALGL